MRIGILAVQGDYEAHGKMIQKLGATPVHVRSAAELRDIDGLILPGGESTAQWKFLVEEGLLEPIREFAHKRGAVFGTCAGVILLAKVVQNPPQESLGLVDITVRRNAYGRQLASEVRVGVTKLKDEPVEMVFIRAPIIDDFGESIEVLAEFEGKPVLIRQGKIVGATFHPELTDDPTVHEYFLKITKNGVR